MNRIVLIGNGFDLAHGLKTSYADFINWYWEQWKERLIKSRAQIEEDKLCYFRLHSAFHNNTLGVLINDYYSTWCNLSAAEFIDTISRNLLEVEVYFSPLLKHIKDSITNKNWVDIEADYYDLLKKCLKNNSTIEVKKLHEHLAYLQDKLIDYLREVHNITIFKNSNIQRIIEQPINKEDISVKALKTIFHSPDYFKGIPLSSTLLLTFNYTDTVDEYANTPNIMVNHIHGIIHKPESIIFGYGDEMDKHYQELEDFNDNNYLAHIKSSKYLDASNYRKLLQFVESAPFQIYIMGHSCGNSDRTLLHTLFEHENCVSIKPFYYQKEDGTDNYTEIAQNISRNFKNKQILRDRVVNKEFCEPLPQTSTN